MTQRRLATVVFLALWVLLGPIAMAFDGCAAMGAMCEVPCGIPSCLSLLPAPLLGLAPIAYLDALPRAELPTNTLTALEPPPKSSVPAA